MINSVRRSFNRAAKHYDQAANFQKQVGNDLLQVLDQCDLSPKIIVDLGAGTGEQSLELRQKFPQARF